MDKSAIDALVALALATATTGREDGGTPFLVLPDGHSVKDVESLMLYPVRARGTIELRDADSFITVVKKHASAATELYANLKSMTFAAVFNDHLPAQAGWRDHKATYACPVSVEWGIWKKQDGQAMSQADFAKFIEDNALDINSAPDETGSPTAPSGAEMIEIARTLEAKKKVNFASAVRLDNGQVDFTFEEQIDSTAAKGRLQVPQEFKIGVAVFEGGEKYAVACRLRYRIGDKGSLFLWFDIVRPHKIVEDAFNSVKKLIADSTGLTILNGG